MKATQASLHSIMASERLPATGESGVSSHLVLPCLKGPNQLAAVAITGVPLNLAPAQLAAVCGRGRQALTLVGNTRLGHSYDPAEASMGCHD